MFKWQSCLQLSCERHFLLKKQLLLHIRKYAKKRLQSDEDVMKMPIFQYASKNTKRSKRIYMWGNTMYGALGNSNFILPGRHQTPLKSMRAPWRLPFADFHKVVDVSCGYGFTVFAASNEENDFTLFGTGLNSDFQIGYQCRRKNKPLQVVAEPVPIALPLRNQKTKAVKVGCGRAHTVVVTDKEGVFSLGNNSYGQCGVPAAMHSENDDHIKIHKIEDVSNDIREVVCGQDHTLLLTENGEVYSFGWSADGQTGLGHYNNQFKPALVKGDIEGERIVQLSCSADCVLAVSDKGDVFGWGNSEYKQLNLATDKQQINISKHLNLGSVGKVKQIASGGTMCAVLNEQGAIYVWGYGILGQGPNVASSFVPTLLPLPLFGVNEFNPDVRLQQIACGLSHFAAVTSQGHLYMWGKNRSNCLGLGRETDQFFPLKVAVPAEVVKVSCGVDHTAVLCKSFA
ncbi:RCC1-like G exchanging factor-like protein [Uloborus diversus]|uniref:RCC1-like G exchanging factor-like protein n=1 Tax=Uloborus diversus TaxID=327109 RepID=UPI00240A836A|nr:RCC1-like G exchanging factor-like protein [Uloborus diversus]